MTSRTISGSLTHGVTLTTPTYNYNPLYVTGAINTATGDGVHGDNTQSWTLGNSGTIAAAAGNGVRLLGGGSVTNGASGAASAVISGNLSGVYIYAPGVTTGTISNFAAINAGANGVGVLLNGAGGITNGAAAITGAVISSGYIAVEIENVPGTVSNFGTVIGTAGGGAVRLDGGGLINGGSSSTAALIDGKSGVAVYNAGGSLTLANYGRIIVDGSTGKPAVKLTTTGTTPNSVVNYGTIAANLATGIYLQKGGLVTNAAGGVISGATAIEVGNAAATITNAGTIIGSAGTAVAFGTASNRLVLRPGGTIQGTVVGGAGSLSSNTLELAAGPATGTITALNTGFVNFGTLDVDLTATWTLVGAAPQTVRSGGTIVSAGGSVGTAVSFGATDDRLILNPGAVFVGKVDGGGGSNTLELAPGAGVGTVAGIGVSIVNFAALTVDAAARWQVTGGTIGAGATLTDSGSLFNVGAIGTTATLTAAAYLSNSGLIDVAGTAIKSAGGAATAVNLGTLNAGSGSGIYLAAGGSVTNGAGSVTNALITGYDGIIVRGGAGVVGNYGTITGSDIFGGGVSLEGGGSLSNLGRIAASGTQSYAVFMVGGSLTNAAGAVITGGGKNGVLIRGAGSIANFGTISATNGTIGVGVSFSGGGDTLINAGMIVGASGTAVIFAGTGGNLLVLEHGYQLQGGVVGNVGASNTLELAGSAGAGVTVGYNGLGLSHFQDVLFGAGGYEALKVSNTSGTLPVTISGFTPASDVIDLTAIGTNGTIAAIDSANHRLTVSGSGGTVTLQLDASDATSFQTLSDGASGTDVTPVCFCRGTLILTEQGEVAVEDLAVGDRVVTLASAMKPIMWIGMGRDLVTRANKLARPIIVREGALANGVPHRDLYLTHGHALYLDGVLIPVENLVNHNSIRWDESSRVVEYYHIELEDHDVVLANGAPTESYYDAGNRAFFHNTRLGSAAGVAEPTSAPVLTGGEVVERAWMSLFRRCGGRIASATTDDPDLRLVVDGRRIDRAAVEGGVYDFALAEAPATPVRLCSRSGVPSLLGITAHDHRRLGVAISRITIRQPGIGTVIEFDAPVLLAGGCHPAEGGYSWTDGELTLPPNLFEHLSGPFTVAVDIERPGMRYPLPHAATATA